MVRRTTNSITLSVSSSLIRTRIALCPGWYCTWMVNYMCESNHYTLNHWCERRTLNHWCERRTLNHWCERRIDHITNVGVTPRIKTPWTVTLALFSTTKPFTLKVCLYLPFLSHVRLCHHYEIMCSFCCLQNNRENGSVAHSVFWVQNKAVAWDNPASPDLIHTVTITTMLNGGKTDRR